VQSGWVATKDAVDISATVRRALDKYKRSFKDFLDLHELSAIPIDRIRDSATGNLYEGHVVRGVPHGWGILYTKKGDVLEGIFNSGKPEKYLRLITADGLDYIGDLKDDKRHGKGTLTKPDGSSVQCDQWVDGQATGIVEERDGSKRLVFRGQRNAKGLFEGQCTVGRPDFVVEGKFKDGLVDGPAKKTYTDGRVYQGLLNKDFVEEGQGSLTFIDGRKFSGPFQRGLPNGEGQFTTDAGKTTKQTWKDGKRI
jgi:hypothetical protein